MMQQISNVPINEIIPYENNARHNDGAVDAVAASIRDFGFQGPILVDVDNVIIAGHTRLKAAQKLGLETVPVIVAADLSPEKVKAFRLADNKTGELSTWDDELLMQELAELSEYNMEDLGFKLDGSEQDDSPDLSTDQGIKVFETYALNVVVSNEQEQAELYERLVGEGFEVKVVSF